MSKQMMLMKALLITPPTAVFACSNETRQDDASAAEKARDLLIRIHTDPDFNATWGPYWASLPAFDEMLLPELFTEEHLQLLQLAALVSLITTKLSCIVC